MKDKSDSADPNLKDAIAKTVAEDDKLTAKLLEKLEEDLEKEKDQRKKARFMWTLVATILLNICFFTSMESFMGPLIIGLLQLVGFTLVARKLGMQEVVQLFDRMLSTIANSAKKNSNQTRP